MKSRACLVSVVLMALGLASEIRAHHSIGMFDLASPVWIKASVVRYEPRNPHVMLELRERTVEGTTSVWTIEGPILPRLERMGLARDFIRPGDVLQICGFPYRRDIAGARLHGMLLILPDGTWQPWGVCGKLDNCVRPQDTFSTWVSFLDAVPMAQEYWCRGLGYPDAARTPKALVDEISRGMRAPCGT